MCQTVIMPAVFMGFKLGLSQWGTNIGWGCSRIGCWEREGAERERVLRERGRWDREGARGLEGISSRLVSSRLVSSPNISRVSSPRKMGWRGHVAVRGRGEGHRGLWWGDVRVRDQSEDHGVDGGTLSWICEKWGERAWTGLIWLRIKLRCRLLWTR